MILAHLGNGASLAAVRHGKSIDTSMGFTPTAGLVMSTRTGDLDPGLVYYLARTERMTAATISADGEPRVRAARRFGDQFRHARLAARRKPATCGRRRPWRCFATRRKNGSAPSPLRSADWTRSSSPGASAKTRRSSATRICDGLGFLGIELDQKRNAKNAPLISPDAGRVKVRVIRTDEELMIARSVTRVLNLGSIRKT